MPSVLEKAGLGEPMLVSPTEVRSGPTSYGADSLLSRAVREAVIDAARAKRPTRRDNASTKRHHERQEACNAEPVDSAHVDALSVLQRAHARRRPILRFVRVLTGGGLHCLRI